MSNSDAPGWPSPTCSGGDLETHTKRLRAGNTHASNSAVALLKRIVSGLRDEWPAVSIELRADAGFAVPALYDY